MPRLSSLATAALFAGLLVPSLARADDRRACVEAYEHGQELKLAHRFVAARAALIRCSDRACPRFIQSECTRWLGEVESAEPSIVLDVHDSAGHEKRATALSVDGTPVNEPLDGRALAIDPGAHDLALVVEGGDKIEQHVVVREGEKRRRIEFVLAVPAPATPAPAAAPASLPAPLAATTDAPPSRSHVPPAAWATGAIGAVALGSFTFFAISGVSMQHDREASCAPRCSQSDLDSLRTKYLIADVSLAVAVVAGAATVWQLLAHDTEAR